MLGWCRLLSRTHSSRNHLITACLSAACTGSSCPLPTSMSCSCLAMQGVPLSRTSYTAPYVPRPFSLRLCSPSTPLRTRVPKDTYTLCTPIEHAILEYCSYMHQYCTACSCWCSALHAQSSLSSLVELYYAWWWGMARNNKINHILWLPLGPTTPKGHTSTSKEMGLALDLGWTSSHPSHSQHQRAKEKRLV